MSISSLSPLLGLPLTYGNAGAASAAAVPIAAAAGPAPAPIKFSAADMLQYMNTVDENGQSKGVSDQGRVVGYMVEFYAGARLKNSPREQQLTLDQINTDINSSNPNERNAAMIAAVASHYKFSKGANGEFGQYDNAKIKSYIQSLPATPERDQILKNFDVNNDITSIGALVTLTRAGQAPDLLQKLTDPNAGLVKDQALYQNSIAKIKAGDVTLPPGSSDTGAGGGGGRANGAGGGGGGGGRAGGAGGGGGGGGGRAGGANGGGGGGG
ncbi:MAG: hypothetical protein K0Q50_2749, partial [Vampirovibrio sp.]|nr:hypothetical protein [Vampirovibrio sp.]